MAAHRSDPQDRLLRRKPGRGVLERLKVSYQSLFLAAAMTVARERPELFGTQTATIAERAAMLTKAAAERDRLLAEIERAWTREDCTMEKLSVEQRRGGYCKLTVRFTEGAVYVSPDIGRHLVDWALSQRAAKAA